MRLTLDIRRQTYTYNIDLHPILTYQLFGFNPTSSGTLRLGILTFILYFFGGSAGVYQPHTTR